MTLPTFNEIWSQYLFNQSTPITGDSLLDENLIRTQSKGSTVNISAVDFMAEGAPGSFVTGANFTFMNYFFGNYYDPNNHDSGPLHVLQYNNSNTYLRSVAEKSDGVVKIDADGTIHFTLAQIMYLNEQAINGNRVEALNINSNPEFWVKSISQRAYLPDGESDYDFAQRVQLFSSTNFQVGDHKNDSKVEFIIKPDGTREVRNFVITPVNMDDPQKSDNFDFSGANNEISQMIGNGENQRLTDPSNIGRQVPFQYTNLESVPKSTYDLDDFFRDQHSLEINNYSDNQAIIIKRTALNVLPGSMQMFKELYANDVISFKDNEGRFVGYGTSENDIVNLTHWRVKEFNRLDDLFISYDESKGVAFVAGSGKDNVEGTDSDDKILGGDGDDTLFGGFGKDHLIGGNNNDNLRGASGDDILEGEDGNDFLEGGFDADKLYGGIGDDFLYGDFENEMISAFNPGGDDLLEGGLGADHLYGGKGSDTLYANKKIDKYDLDLLDSDSNTLVGGDGSDILIGGMGDDILIAGESEFDDSDEYSNELYGGLGADTLYGSAGDDQLYAMGKITNALDVEENILYGEGGNDKLYGSYGDDIIYTGSTNTNKTFFGFPDGDDIGTKNEVYGYNGNDKIYGEDGDDKIYGDEGDDIIEGNRGKDVLFGGDGDDEIYGGGGGDVLAGGSGNDLLAAGAGGDVLMGDVGYDTYKYIVRENKISQGWSWVDHIYDIDGVGEIRMDKMMTFGFGQQILVNSYKLQIGEQVTNNTWLSTNEQYYITRYEKTRLVLNYEGSDENFKTLYNPLKNDSREYHLIIQSANYFEHQYHVWFWKDGDLGLVLPDAPPPEPELPPTPRVPNPPPPPRDPLSLDLNKDGKISTISKNPGVYFDLDNSNFAEKTSWIAPEDGLLVLDRNANGKIDGGAELFGTETFLADGTLASNGYLALKELDSNNDGVISDADQIYHQLRLWQDINSNGVSENGELKSLLELGIKSIDLNYQSNSTVDVNNVEHRENSTFTYLDDTKGITNTLWFDTDKQDSVPVVIHNGAEIPIDEDIKLLPELAGFGNVYSLHHAMQLDTTGKLKELVKEFSAQFEDNEARLALVEEIILQWTGVTQIPTNGLGANINAQHVRALEKLLGNQPAVNVSQAEFVGIEQVYQQNFKYVYTMLMSQTHSAHLFDKIDFIEQANGQWSADFSKLNEYLINTVTMEPISADTLYFLKDMTPIMEGIDPYNSNIFNTFKQTLDQELKNNLSVEDYNLVQTFLNSDDPIFGTTEKDSLVLSTSNSNVPIFLLDGDDTLHGASGSDRVYGNAGNDEIFGAGGADKLYGGGGNDALYGESGDDVLYGESGDDTLEGGAGNDVLDGGLGNDIYIYGQNFGHDNIYNYDIAQSRQDTIQFTDGLVQSDFTYRRVNNDLVIKTIDQQNSITVRNYFNNDALGNDRIDIIKFSDNTALNVDEVKALVLLGTNNTDILQAYASGSIIHGEAGNDDIYGRSGIDTLYGDDGDDRIFGGAGNDTLFGGGGQDFLNGEDGNDNYVFDIFSGQDTISDYYGLNTLKLKNIIEENVVVSFSPISQSDVLISYGNNNTILIKDFFVSQFNIEFDNGVVWDKYEISSKIKVNLNGTDSSDNLSGHAFVSDYITGLDGDDNISAYAGNDTLIGGRGNDILNGGIGKDIYIFAPNFGHDVIYNDDSTSNRQDIIQFTDGLVQSDFTYRRDNDDLIIKTLDGQNSITVRYYFDNDAIGQYSVDVIKFSDAVSLNIDAVKALVLLGTEASEILQAYASGSEISAGAGEDVLQGKEGNDTFYGGDGQDKLYGNAGNDYLDGGASADEIYGGVGDDQLKGDSGADRLEGGDGNDQLYGGLDDDELFGGNGNDTLNGSQGNDILNAGHGNDIYRFNLGWGNDQIQNEYKNDNNEIDMIEFVGINPTDIVIRKVGQDMLITHRVTGDQVVIQSQFDQYVSNKPIQFIYFDDGTKWNLDDLNVQAVKGTELDDIIEGTTDHDVIHAGEGDDLITGTQFYSEHSEMQYFVYGEAGNDIINGSGYLDGGVGDDEVSGQGHLLGGDGNDVITGSGILEGQNGDDVLFGQGSLFGGNGNDQLTLTELGNEAGQLSGGDGNDTLIVDVNRKVFVDDYNHSEFVQDADGYHIPMDQELIEAQRAVYIEGGKGNDILNGSFGDEVYLFNLGDGQDTIIERPAGQNYINVAVSFDVLRFGSNITTTEISLHRYGADLVVKHSNNSDQITIQNYFNGGHYKINEIQFADHTVWNNSYIENNITYHGSAGIDEVWGYRDSHEIFEMDAGDDKVYAGAGNDIIYGRAGNDLLWGQAGNDTLVGGAGADYLEGSEGDDTIFGDEDNDTLYGGLGNDSLFGGLGNDILSGGTGTDTFNGGAGDDKYYYNLADGADVINQTGGGTDVLWLMDNGITRDRISFSKVGNDLVVMVDQNANQAVRIIDHFLGGEKAISSVNANGQVPITAKEIDGIIKAQAYGELYDIVLEGTSATETIYGTSGKDLIQGLDGNDTIWAQAGNDRLEGGTGNDYLDGGAGDDAIYGGIGNDTLIGGTGADILDGGAGDDKYYYYLTDGADVIDQTGGGNDVIWLMDQGITEDRIKFTKENNDLLITIDNNSNQSIRVKDHFLGGEKAISSVQPNGGYTITAAQIAAKVNSSGNGTGTPNPVGDTTYNYTSGALTITEQSGTDKVVFASGITFSQISSNLIKSGNDLIIKVNGSTTNIVTVKNFFLAGNYLVETFQTVAGEQITANQIFTVFGLTMPGTGSETPNPVGDTTYNYTSGALTITEQSGTDKVVFASGITFSQISSNLTKSGNDLIIKVNGSTANIVTVKNFFLAGNYLVETFQTAAGEQITANQIFTAFGLTMPGTGGGAANAEGDTTYNYTSGDLTITEVSGNDKIVFASGITFSQIGNYLTMSGNDLILKVNGSTTNKITVKNFFLAGNNLVETFKFSTGEEITADDIFGAFGLTLPSVGGGTETGSSEVEGDTTYEYTTGALMINEVSGNDKVVFKNGITFSQIGNYLNMSGNDLILKLDGSNTNKVTVKDFFLGGDYVVETFAFETGGQITASQIFGAFGLTMPAATSLASVENFSLDEESSMSSDEVYQDFGANSPLNAEDIVQSVIIGDAGDNLFISDSAVSELFILNGGQDIIKLMQNTSGVTAVDYVNDFKISEDQLDLSEFLDNSQVNSSNLDEFLTISYDENFKTNTISVTGDASGNSQEILVLTNQAEFLSVQDLLLNQSIVY